MTATRDELKQLIDQLPEERLATVRAILLYLQPTGPIPEGLTAEARKAVALAEEVLDNKENAARWLGTPLPLFDGACPIDLLDTPKGIRRVEEILHRIEHGLYS